MHNLKRLEDLYNELSNNKPIQIYVAPPIRFAYKKSDYLYLFYKDILTASDHKVTGVSTAGHLKFIAGRLLGKPCILHYHWIEFNGFLSGFIYFYKLLCIFLFKLMGGKLIWSVHNKMPQDSHYEWFNFKARKWLAKKADLLHVECKSVIVDVSTFFSVHPQKFRVWPHPQYPPQLMPRAAAIEAINHRFDVNIKIQDRLFLMFGHISPYKQIDKVCNLFLDLPVQKKLIIVGPVKKGQMRYFKLIRRLTKKSTNIILIPQFIKEEYVPEFMNAADYVLFNYIDILSPGGVPIANSYNKSIILPRSGCLKEQEGENLYFFKSQDDLKEIIKKC